MEYSNRSSSHAVRNIKRHVVLVRAYVDAQGTEEHARKRSPK